MDHLRRIDERPVEVEEGSGGQNLVWPVLEQTVHVPGAYLRKARRICQLEVDGGDADLIVLDGREVGAFLFVVAGGLL